MDKSFDGVLDAVTNGRFLLIGMQKTKIKKKSERVRDMTGRITSSWNTTCMFFCFFFVFFATAGQCRLPRMLRSCDFSSAIFFPFRDENLKMPRPRLTHSFHVAQRIRGGLICLSLATRIGLMKYFFRGRRRKENVDLRHATNDTQVKGGRWSCCIFPQLDFPPPFSSLPSRWGPPPTSLQSPSIAVLLDGQIIGRKIASGAGLIWQLTASLHHVHYYAQVFVPI